MAKMVPGRRGAGKKSKDEPRMSDQTKELDPKVAVSGADGAVAPVAAVAPAETPVAEEPAESISADPLPGETGAQYEARQNRIAKAAEASEPA